MKKLVLISCIIFVVVVILITIFLGLRNDNLELENNSSDNQISVFPNSVSDSGVAQNQEKKRWDFLRNPNNIDVTVDGWEGYIIDSEADAAGNIFEIYYSVPDDSFVVSLGALPLSNSRLRAESSLLEMLNMLPEDICRLNIDVTVPYSVDEEFAGQDVGLSFCPGSIAL